MYGLPVVVCDVGTSVTRLGYAGNSEPTIVQPTQYDTSEPSRTEASKVNHNATLSAEERGKSPVQARERNTGHSLLDHGIVQDWDSMERYCQHFFYHQLCVEPEKTDVVWAMPTSCPSQERARVAEMLFESFGTPQLSIVSSALCALCSVGGPQAETALVVECGAGVTEVVPIVDGYVLASAVRSFPIAGDDLTQYLVDFVQAQQPHTALPDSWAVAEDIKTTCCYVSQDVPQTLADHAANPSAYAMRHVVTPPRLAHRSAVSLATPSPVEVEVGCAQFLAPELLFTPSRVHPSWRTSLTDLLDATVWSCPVDCRRRLYANVIVTGGTTRFPNFARRLRRSLRDMLRARAADFTASAGGTLQKSVHYEVQLHDGSQELHAAWKGGSVHAATGAFSAAATTRAAYLERGCLSREGA